MFDVAYMYPVCEVGSPGAPVADYGVLAPDAWVRDVLAAEPIDLIVLHEQTFRPAKPNRPAGPYFPWRRDELERFLAAIHTAGKKLALYTSPFYWVEHSGMSVGDYVTMCNELMRLGIDGLYLDGLLMQDRAGSLDLVARLREKLGPNAVLFAHVSHKLIPAGQETVWPEVEEYVDLVADGEGIEPAVFLARAKQHVKPVVWISGSFSQAGWSDEAIGVTTAVMGLHTYDWISATYTEGAYTWRIGSAKRRLYAKAKKLLAEMGNVG